MKTTVIAAAVALSALASHASASTIPASATIWDTGAGANGHGYELVNGSISWTEAKAAAEQLGGYLVTITSAAEQMFLNDIINTADLKAWIGLVDVDQTGDYAWVTGETFSYENWANGEPNNNAGGEQYGLGWWNNSSVEGGSWNDCPNNGCLQTAYIVEYDVAPVPLPASLPLIAMGLGALGVMRKRRKAA